MSQSTVKEYIGMRFEHIECRHYGGEGGPQAPSLSAQSKAIVHITGLI